MLSIAQRIESLPELKLRASSGGDLAAAISRLTDKQVIELKELLAKPSPTALQMGKIQELTHKRDNPELSQGAKTFAESWLWEKMRGKKMDIHNKFLTKGLIVEDDNIELAGRALNWDFCMKNEKNFEDEFFTGTPDLKITINKLDYIVDIKSSWDENSFKFFNPAYDRGYMFQLQIYMHLTGVRNASLVFVLGNTPLHLIEKEAWSRCRDFGYPTGKDITETEIYADLVDKMTFDDLPDDMRVKKFDFHYDGYIIDTLIDGIKETRKYKNQLVEKYFGVKLF